MARVAPMWFRKKTQPLWEKYILPLAPQIKTYLEIGTGEGGSVRWVLENLPVELAVTVDPFLGEMAGREASARAYLEKWLDTADCPRPMTPLRMVKEPSVEYLCYRICDEPIRFDFIYVDGDHDALPVLTDCVLAWQLLKPGGIMAMDDWDRSWKDTRRHGRRPGAKQGVEGFLTCIFGQYEKVFEASNQICIRRL